MYTRMECHPMFTSVYISLILMTAGFVLTLCSWLAPPLNDVVDFVRIAGLASLLIGSVLLSIACIVGSFNQGRCCTCCYACETRRQPKGSFLAQSIENPFLTTAILGSTLCTEERGGRLNNDKSPIPGVGQCQSFSFDDNDSEALNASDALVIENVGARAVPTKCAFEKSKRKQDYQLIPTQELDYNVVSSGETYDAVNGAGVGRSFGSGSCKNNGEAESSFILCRPTSKSDSGGKSELKLVRSMSNDTSAKSNSHTEYKYQEPPPAYMYIANHSKYGSEFANSFEQTQTADPVCASAHDRESTRAVIKTKSNFEQNSSASAPPLVPDATAFKMESQPTTIYSYTNKGIKTSTTFPALISNNTNNTMCNVSNRKYSKSFDKNRSEHSSSLESYNQNCSERKYGGAERKDCVNNLPTCYGRTNSVQIKIYENFGANNDTKSHSRLESS